MLEHLDLFIHPRFVVLPKIITKRRVLSPRHATPATGRRSPPRRDWCDAQVTSLPRVDQTFRRYTILAEVNPATRQGLRRRYLESPCPPADGDVGTGMPQPSRAVEPGHRVALCPTRPAPNALEFHPFVSDQGTSSISPTFVSELARDGALYTNKIIDVN